MGLEMINKFQMPERQDRTKSMFAVLLKTKQTFIKLRSQKRHYSPTNLAAIFY